MMDDAERRRLRGLALALWAFVALNAADAALTLYGVGHAGAHEAAPVASVVIARFGAPGLLALKAIIVAGTWAPTWALARRYPDQLPRPLARIVASCCVLVAGGVALDVAALAGWRY